MSRLRAQLSKSDIDRKVATSMSEVERKVLSALQECGKHMRSTKNPVEATRTRGLIRDLNRVLGAVSGVRRVSPIYDTGDRDLQPSPEPTPKAKRPAPTPTV